VAQQQSSNSLKAQSIAGAGADRKQLARCLLSYPRIQIAHMLRITQTETETEQRWTLCGRLTGPSVALLRACWEHDHQGTDVRRRVLDLSDVTSIDESGEKLLAEMRSGGAALVAAGVATRHLLENLCASEPASGVTIYRSARQRHSRKSNVIKTGGTSEESA
jgi:hypothetical protein